MLTPPERARALKTRVHYAAHPFKRFAKLGMSLDGLRCVGGGGEETELSCAEVEDVEACGGPLSLPLVWSHAHTGRHALMPHTRCMESIVVEGREVRLEQVRSDSIV